MCAAHGRTCITRARMLSVCNSWRRRRADHRNAIIATIAGSAIVQYDKGEGRPPLAAAGLLAIGALYMYVGSATYVWQVPPPRPPARLHLPKPAITRASFAQTFRLRRTLGLAPANVAFGLVNAAWPVRRRPGLV